MDDQEVSRLRPDTAAGASMSIKLRMVGVTSAKMPPLASSCLFVTEINQGDGSVVSAYAADCSHNHASAHSYRICGNQSFPTLFRSAVRYDLCTHLGSPAVTAASNCQCGQPYRRLHSSQRQNRHPLSLPVRRSPRERSFRLFIEGKRQVRDERRVLRKWLPARR